MDTVLIEELIHVLSETERNYVDLLTVILTEQELVQKAKAREMIGLSVEKGRLLQAIKRTDQNRAQVIRKVAAALNLPADELTLTMLAERIDPEQGGQLKRLRNSLQKIINKVRMSNNESRALICHCAELVHQALNLATPHGGSTPIYKSTGALTQGDRGGKLLSNNA